MDEAPQPGRHAYTAKLTLGAKGGSKPAPKISLKRKIAGIAIFVMVIAIFAFTASQLDIQLPGLGSQAQRTGRNGGAAGQPVDNFVRAPGSVEVPNVLVEEIDGQTFLGIRAVLEADVWRVDWNEKTVILRAEKYKHPSIEFHAHSTTVIIGDATEELAIAPIVRQRRLLVPIEWLVKFTDGRMAFNPVTKKTYLVKNKEDLNATGTSTPEAPPEPELETAPAPTTP